MDSLSTTLVDSVTRKDSEAVGRNRVRSARVTPTLPLRSLRRSATLLRKAVTLVRLTSLVRSVAAAYALASLSASRISRLALRR
jgi:hypothetical protein